MISSSRGGVGFKGNRGDTVGDDNMEAPLRSGTDTGNGGNEVFTQVLLPQR